MSSIPRVSLEDTLTLLTLARETALAKGREVTAQQLAPVMEGMQELVATARKSQPSAPPARGDMGGEGFGTLLKVSQADTAGESSLNAVMERNRLIQAMSAGNMSETEIARQFGITREEVRLVLAIHKNAAAGIK